MFVNINDAAAILDVNYTTVYRWVKDAKLAVQKEHRNTKIPFVALLNYLISTRRMPFKNDHIEQGAYL